MNAYGKPPYRVAVIHGGPGALGGMAPVARELAANMGVLEPLQTAGSIDGLLTELRKKLETRGEPPIALIGHSWGAWLSYLFAARYPAMVRKVILVGSGPFAAKDAQQITETRLGRLNEEERSTAHELERNLFAASDENRDLLLARFGRLMAKTDAYDPLPERQDDPEVQVRLDLYQSIWQEAAELRASGQLLAAGEQIRSPVVAVHGDYDPHPYDGVRKPLSGIVKDFRFILLPRCGHTPWKERHAKDTFYRLLLDELA